MANPHTMISRPMHLTPPSRGGTRGPGRLLRRWGGLIAIVTVAAATGGWLFAESVDAKYHADAVLGVNDGTAGALSGAPSAQDLERVRAQAETEDVAASAAAAAGFDTAEITIRAGLDYEHALVLLRATAPTSQGAVKAAVEASSEIQRLSVSQQVTELESALAGARLLAARWTDLFTARVDEHRRLLDMGATDEAAAVNRLMWHTSNRRTTATNTVEELELRLELAAGNVVSLDLPIVGEETSPAPWSYALLAAVAAASVSVGGLMAWDDRRDIIGSMIDLAVAAPNSPIIAAANQDPADDPRVTQTTAPQNGSAAPISEAYRYARMALSEGKQDHKIGVYAVTPVTSHRGALTAASQLAAAFASTGRSTLLINADLASQPPADSNGIPLLNALPHAVGSAGTEVELLTTALSPDLDILAHSSARCPGDPRPQTSARAYGRVIEHAAGRYETVIIDCPPVLAAADTSALCATADATLLEVALGEVQTTELHRSLSVLRRHGNNQIRLLAVRPTRSTKMPLGPARAHASEVAL